MTSRVIALFVSSSPGTIRTDLGAELAIASPPRVREHKALPVNGGRGPVQSDDAESCPVHPSTGNPERDIVIRAADRP